ncbi:hypothetical protein VTL71DRAFT_13210 [Oculimacula yallundae]|uniref:Uncharacterized protein n=1 Tax=Oculimacula yallundae TaxID=86028 RepID=A0ABR4CKA2_9HELO
MKPLLPLRIAISLLLIAISASLLSLIGSSLTWKASHKHETATFTSKDGAEQAVLVIFPLYLQIGSYAILIAAGCGGLVDQLLYLLFTLVKRNMFGSRIRNSMIAKTLISLRLCIGVAASIFSFVQYYGSSIFQMSYTPADGVYGVGHFTMEAWTCQTRERIVDGYQGNFGRLCKEGKAARWMLIPYVLLSILLLGLEVWLGRRRSKISEEEDLQASHTIENTKEHSDRT